jgi:hypothetical protein
MSYGKEPFLLWAKGFSLRVSQLCEAIGITEEVLFINCPSTDRKCFGHLSIGCGRRIPIRTLVKIIGLAAQHGISLEWLFTGDGSMKLMPVATGDCESLPLPAPIDNGLQAGRAKFIIETCLTRSGLFCRDSDNSLHLEDIVVGIIQLFALPDLLDHAALIGVRAVEPSRNSQTVMA